MTRVGLTSEKGWYHSALITSIKTDADNSIILGLPDQRENSLTILLVPGHVDIDIGSKTRHLLGTAARVIETNPMFARTKQYWNQRTIMR